MKKLMLITLASFTVLGLPPARRGIVYQVEDDDFTELMSKQTLLGAAIFKEVPSDDKRISQSLVRSDINVVVPREGTITIKHTTKAASKIPVLDDYDDDFNTTESDEDFEGDESDYSGGGDGIDGIEGSDGGDEGDDAPQGTTEQRNKRKFGKSVAV